MKDLTVIWGFTKMPCLVSLKVLRELKNAPFVSICFMERTLTKDKDESLIPSLATFVVFCLRLQLHGAIYRPDSSVLMLRYCANLKAIRYESTSFNRIVADKSHRVIVA